MFASAWTLAACLAGASTVEPARGFYVEARTASVFAGACHYGGEYTTQGREAVLAWRFDAGKLEDLPLAGLETVAVVAADRNLAEPDAVRRSVLFLPEELSEVAAASLGRAIACEYRAVLGNVVEIRRCAVAVDRDGDRYRVRAGNEVELAGEALADRACCAQPFNVWYEPLVPLDSVLVGRSERFHCAERALCPTWDRSGENNAFLGAFRLDFARSR